MSIDNTGNHDFERVGSVRWQPNGWDLDRLIVPYQGSAANLDAFIADLDMWETSSIDGNMYLSDWVNDGDPTWPTVDLIYIGKKGGTLPPNKHSSGSATQGASFQSEGGSISLAVTYVAPTTSLFSITATGDPVLPDDPGGPIAEADLVNVRAVHHDTAEELDIYAGDPLSYFAQNVVTSKDSEEIVPGVYWRNTATKTLILFSL